jgi:uncharacterized repeat protein (TIGR03847 family)
MRSLGRLTHFAAGAAGPPGRRTFYLEIEGAAGREWFLVEKEQVAALATHGLETLGRPADPAGAPQSPPGPPGEPTFRVGDIGLGAEAGEVLVLLSPAEPAADPGRAAPPAPAEPVAFSVETGVFVAMARAALALVAAGRPRCRLCGLPQDPDGHACPGGNGDLRRR